MDAILVGCDLLWGRCPDIKQTGSAMQLERYVHGVLGVWIGIDNGMVGVSSVRFLDVGKRCKVDFNLVASHLLWTQQVFLE